METMKFVNPTEHTVNLSAIGLAAVPPGGEIDVPLYLAAASRTDAGNRGKSAIEAVAPQLKPKSAEDEKAWREVPAPPIPQSKIVSVAVRTAAEPAGVKALRDQKEAAAKAQTQGQSQAATNAVPKATGAPQTNASAPAGKTQG